jgi:hypothetical protein
MSRLVPSRLALGRRQATIDDEAGAIHVASFVEGQE